MTKKLEKYEYHEKYFHKNTFQHYFFFNDVPSRCIFTE